MVNFFLFSFVSVTPTDSSVPSDIGLHSLLSSLNSLEYWSSINNVETKT